MTLYVWKFLVPGDAWVPVPGKPGYDAKGCLALAIAETQEEAERLIREEKGDLFWLPAATVTRIDLTRPRFLGHAEV